MDWAAAISWRTSIGSARSRCMTTAQCRSILRLRSPAPSVELRFEMDTLVLFHTCPHPLELANSAISAKTGAVRDFRRAARSVRRSLPAFRPENERGFENNRIFSRAAVRRLINDQRKHVREAARLSQYRPAGDYWMHVVHKGETLRILDLEGNQAADTLFFNADDPAERYSASDTIREQGNIYLTAGTVLRPTCCRPMLTITADTVGRHDTLGGACATESNTVRYALEKKSMHACRDSFLLAIAENEHYGLTKRDIGHNINFFMNVPVTPDGGLTFEDGLSAPGKYVEMRARDERHRADLATVRSSTIPATPTTPRRSKCLIWANGG